MRMIIGTFSRIFEENNVLTLDALRTLGQYWGRSTDAEAAISMIHFYYLREYWCLRRYDVCNAFHNKSNLLR